MKTEFELEMHQQELERPEKLFIRPGPYSSHKTLFSVDAVKDRRLKLFSTSLRLEISWIRKCIRSYCKGEVYTFYSVRGFQKIPEQLIGVKYRLSDHFKHLIIVKKNAGFRTVGSLNSCLHLEMLTLLICNNTYGF